MKKLCLLPIAVLSLATAAAAEDFDGSRPLICKAVDGHDCLPTERTCKPLKPEKGKDLNLKIDVASKTVKSPFRNALLPIQNVMNNTASLVLQGASSPLVWNATVHRTTGRLTIAIIDREGAYVVFGQCELALDR